MPPLKFDKDPKLAELKQTFEFWKEVVTSVSGRRTVEEHKVDKTSFAGKDTPRFSEPYIRDSILSLLETRADKGMNGVSLHSILRDTFRNEYFMIRRVIRKLLNEGAIVKKVNKKQAIYILRKYSEQEEICYVGTYSSFVSSSLIITRLKLPLPRKANIIMAAAAALMAE